MKPWDADPSQLNPYTEPWLVSVLYYLHISAPYRNFNGASCTQASKRGGRGYRKWGLGDNPQGVASVLFEVGSLS